MIKPGAPKYYTRRNPSRPTLGMIVGKISEIVRGYPLMPWQQYVANVAWELDPDHPGELYYSEGDVTVPRQSGKSDLGEAFHHAGAFMFNNWQSYMSAQTGKDASKRFRALVAGLQLETGWRGQDWKISRGKGYERAVYLPRASSIEPFAPTKDALHGDHLNFVTLDETWAFDFDEGMDLETAIKPTFLTMRLSQLLRLSTKGTANSSYLNYNIELGRNATADPTSRRYYFEWSADEELADQDPYSDATLAFHPAIGHTQTARKIRELGKDMPVGEWRRSFLNLETHTAETLIDLAMWDSLRADYDPGHEVSLDPPAPSECVLAWDCGVDGKTATIYAAWLNGSDPVCRLVATQPGTVWLTGALRALATKGYRAIIADDTGVNRTILQELSKYTLTMNVLTYGQYATACQTFFDRVKTGTLTHDGAQSVTIAISVAASKITPHAMILDARNSKGNIDPLRALAIAQDGAVRLLSVSTFQLF